MHCVTASPSFRQVRGFLSFFLHSMYAWFTLAHVTDILLEMDIRTAEVGGAACKPAQENFGPLCVLEFADDMILTLPKEFVQIPHSSSSRTPDHSRQQRCDFRWKGFAACLLPFWVSDVIRGPSHATLFYHLIVYECIAHCSTLMHS